jgi:hypothetical protein
MLEKIVHLADFQLEARNSGIGNRYDEYKNGLNDTLSSVRRQSPSIIVITGDLYQFADTSSAERKLLTWFLRELSKIASVVITNGNHDLKQRNNQLIMSDKHQTQPDDIESVLDAMLDPNITYLKRTGFYDVYGKTFAVWGHYEKFNRVGEDTLPYSPWELPNASDYLELAENGSLIELYHDPISNCKGFSGKPERHFEDYKIDVNNFKAKIVLAGDIHAPDIIQFGNGSQFTYCSSTIMRNYGEGNYYRNSHLYQNGNDMHGYNVITHINGTYVIEFTPIKPRVGRHTIIFDKEFDYNDIESIDVVACEFNQIRFVVEDKVNDFFNNQEGIISLLKSKYKCIIEEPKFDKNVGIDMDDEHTIDDIESIVTEEKILELSEIYIDKIIDKTTTIPTDDKASAKKMLIKLFRDEFSKRTDVENLMKNVAIKKMFISNALSFGDGVVVHFDESGITRITGTNAVGKTKIFTILGYMFTDKIYSEQKSTQVKGNRLDLFNYTRPNDEIINVLEFEINNQAHTLTKTITRTWKRGKNMWNDKNWRDHVTGTPELIVELVTPSGTITDINEVNDFMADLISFEEFHTHLFVNQKSLESLLKMNPDLLIGEILKIIGLNFFDSLNESFDGVKDKMTDRLIKPAGTLDSLLDSIGYDQSEMENTKTTDLEVNDGIDILEEEQLVSNDKRENLVRQIGNAKTVDEVGLLIVENEYETTKRLQEIAKMNDVIIELKSFLDLNTILGIRADTDLIKIEINIESKTLAGFESSLDKHTTLVENLKNECRNYRTENENDKTSQKNVINESINAQRTIINNCNEELQKIKNIILERIDVKKNERQHTIDDVNYKLNQVVSNINTIDADRKNCSNEIERLNATNSTITFTNNGLQDGKKCPTCQRDKDDSTLLAINESIELNKGNILINTDKINVLLRGLENLDSKHLSESKQMNDISAELILAKVDVTYSLKDDLQLTEQATVLVSRKKEGSSIIENLESSKIGIDEDKSYLKSEYITSRLGRIKNIDVEELEIKKNIIRITLKIEGFSNNIVGNDTKIDNIRIKEMLLVKEEYNLINTTKDYGILSEKDIYLKSELEIAKSSKFLYDDIMHLKNEDLERKAKILEMMSSKAKYATQVGILEANIVRYKLEIEQLREYTLTTAVIKQYKTMLGKTGIQKYIFGKIVDILNVKLSDLLEDVDFRLFFDKESLDLRKYDLSKNIISGVQMTSGMETSILGLSLLNSLKMLNQIRKFNFIMIDEVSGQLNSGKDLSYDAQDYQELFVKLLHKILNSSSIYIVDHVLESLGESKVIEVQGTNNGSIVTEIKL